LSKAIDSVRLQVAEDLVNHISVLGERYDDVLPSLTATVQALELKVNQHLVSLGISR
jgi:hypothetical protein